MSRLKKVTRRRTERRQFVVCVTGSEFDLELSKLYQILQDEEAAEANCLRIIDESGEDYLYPASFFAVVEISKRAERALLRTS